MARLALVLVGCAAGLLAILLWDPGSLAGAERSGGGTPHRVPARAAASARPAGTLVLMSGTNRLTAIDVASGRRTSRRVPAVAQCGPELYVTAGHVIFAAATARRTIVFAAPLSLDRPPTRLGSAHVFLPSATPGRVWLAGTRCTRRTMIGVREVTVDGDVTVASARHVPGTWVDGAVDGGLVVLRERALSVWDPSSGAAGAPLGLAALADTHGSRMIGCKGTACRNLAIVDARSGREVLARPSTGYRFDLGAEFSPDGSLIAVPALAHRRWRVALVDARTGTSSLIPSSGTGAVYPRPSWSASSGWLFFDGGSRRIMAFRPGAARAVRLPFRLPKHALSFTAG